MNILSLFDGMSCGQIAINRLGIKYDNYFASEIDKYAMQVTKANYPDTKHIGSVVDVKGENLPKIDLLIGGSPCQSFSFCGKRNGMSTSCSQEILTLEHYLELKADGFEFEGQSFLFWEYMRLLKETKPKYFLLENVLMGQKWQKILSQTIGIDPIMINSSLLSGQSRKRLYWTNIGTTNNNLFGIEQVGIKQPQDKGILLRDILQKNVSDQYFINQLNKNYSLKPMRLNKKFTQLNGEGKSICLCAKSYNNWVGDYITECFLKTETNKPIQINQKKEWGNQPYQQNRIYSTCGKSPTLDTQSERKNIYESTNIRRLTPVECERLQTVPDNYTNHVIESQRYRMLGNGWTVDVILHILKHMEL
jgi:DNA-cytosine methyltransferase